jgi:hypothetical protein
MKIANHLIQLDASYLFKKNVLEFCLIQREGERPSSPLNFTKAPKEFAYQNYRIIFIFLPPLVTLKKIIILIRKYI